MLIRIIKICDGLILARHQACTSTLHTISLHLKKKIIFRSQQNLLTKNKSFISQCCLNNLWSLSHLLRSSLVHIYDSTFWAPAFQPFNLHFCTLFVCKNYYYIFFIIQTFSISSINRKSSTISGQWNSEIRYLNS